MTKKKKNPAAVALGSIGGRRNAVLAGSKGMAKLAQKSRTAQIEKYGGEEGYRQEMTRRRMLGVQARNTRRELPTTVI